MPTYEYACRDCGQHLEVVQGFKDAALTECGRCGGRLRKVFSAAGLIFKGSGYYVTDSRKPAGAAAGSDGSSDSSDSSDSSKAKSTGDGATKDKGSSTDTSTSADSSASSDTSASSDSSASSRERRPRAKDAS